MPRSAFLGRYRGQTRVHTESDLRVLHLQFEALITTARKSSNPYDLALVALLGLLGLRIFEACGSNIADLGEEHGHRVLRVCGKVVLVPLPPAVARAVDDRTSGPLLRHTHGRQMDWHAATRRRKHLAAYMASGT